MNDEPDMNRSPAWPGIAASVPLNDSDEEVMEAALSLVPELRIVAFYLKRARELSLQYPLDGVGDLEPLLQDEGENMGGHRVGPEGLRRYVVTADFPVEHEGELASLIYAALGRCAARDKLRSALEHFDAELGA